MTILVVLSVSPSCGSNSAQFYLDKLDESKRSLGKCITFKGSWFTPSEFETYCGKKTKKWIVHLGKPLSVYSLSCPPKQGAEHGSGVASHCPQGHTPQGRSQSTARSASLPSVSSQRLPMPLLVNAVLSFVKAYRLKGDIESLKRKCLAFQTC